MYILVRAYYINVYLMYKLLFHHHNLRFIFCFNACENAFWPCRNRQSGASFYHKCLLKWIWYVFFESLILLQMHDKASEKAVFIRFEAYKWRKMMFFCAFLDVIKRWCRWVDCCIRLIIRLLEKKYILKRFSVSAFQLFFEGCHFSSFYIFIYIIYWLLISYIKKKPNLKNNYISNTPETLKHWNA